VALKLFLRDPIDNGQMIDLAITWCKVNATKKIREFCLMGTISANKNTIGRLWRERIFCGFHSLLATRRRHPLLLERKRPPGRRPSINLTAVEALGLKLPLADELIE